MGQDVSTADEEIRSALRACRDLAVAAFSFGGAVNLLYLAPSLFMLQVYDRVLQTGGLSTLAFISVLLLFALATLAFLDSLRVALMSRLSLRLDKILSPRLLEAALIRDRRGGAGGRRQVLRAFDVFRTTMTGPAAVGAMDAPWAPIYIIVAFLIHPVIGLVAIVGGAILVGLAIANERALRKRLATATEMAPRVYAAQEAEDSVGDVIRALGMSGPLLARQMERRSELNTLQLRSQIQASRFSSATKFVRLLLQSAALGIGAWLAVERQISPGALIAGSILTSRALAPLEQIVGSWRQLGEARNAYFSVRDLLAAAPPQTVHTLLPKPRGALRVERVGVRLDDERPIIAEISFAVEPGEVLGVIGASGAGKSTLARVIAGAIQPGAGIVRLDDANFLDWDADTLGSHIGYLPQDVLLLSGTIAENIRRFNTPVGSDGQMDGAVAAAIAAGVHQQILHLPKGYETPLGLGGVGLSMGQAQRVALARALYGEPALLVLDEPNAHLDQEGEAALLQAITNAKTRGAATVLVAHRQGPISLCDRLLVLQNGRMDMIGPRDEVLTRLSKAAPRVVRSAGA